MEAVNTVRIPPRSYHNCEVKSIDTSNNLAEVEIPSPDGQRMLVKYEGNMPLAVNDIVRIWTSDDYQIGWIDGDSSNTIEVDKVHSPDGNTEVIVTDNSGDTDFDGDISLSGDVGVYLRQNNWQTVDDHFNTFSGWTWDTADFNDAPSTVDTSTYPSLVRLINDNTTDDHFAYNTVAGESVTMVARVAVGVDSYVGLRADNENDDDFLEFRVIEGTSGNGYMALQRRHRVSGGSVTTATIIDDLPSRFVDIELRRVSTTDYRWYYGFDTPFRIFIASQAPSAVTWTTTRYGLIFGQRGFASNADRAGFVDYFKAT